MAITITLSGAIAERLQAYATESSLSLDLLVEKLLANALPIVETNGVYSSDDEDEPTLEEVVAMIKATPPNPDAIERGDKVGDMDYVQYLLENPPTDTMTAAEWDEQWQAFERELKELDQVRAMKRGLL